VLQYHIWVRGQPTIFDKRYFKYEVQHDPVPRYTGTEKTNWAIQFWMNKIRIYHERDAVIKRVRGDVSKIRLKGYSYEENEQAISLICRFRAENLKKVRESLDEFLFPLINAVHPTFCTVIDAFGIEQEKSERRAIIEGRINPTGLNRLSRAYGKNPEFNRNPPPHLRKAVFKKDNFTCQLCGVIVPNISELHADHIHPVTLGGLTMFENLQTLCASCNLKKGGRLIS